MDFTNALQVLKETYSFLQPSIPGIVAALMATLFVRKNTQGTEIEKLKQQRFDNLAQELLNEGRISHVDYYKCNNFLKIARIADEIARERKAKADKEFDFDWFLRFFEASSNIGNEHMQILWAKVLAGEVNASGSFSLRTIETLSKLSRREALIFQELSNIAIQTSEGMWFVVGEGASSFNLDEIDDLVVPNDKVRLLQECGLLNPIKDDLIIWFSTVPIKNPVYYSGNFFLLNSKSVLLFHVSQEMQTKIQNTIDKKQATFFPYYAFTEAGRQLLSIVIPESEYNFLLQLGAAIAAHVKPDSKRIVTAHSIIKVEETGVCFDDQNDLLLLK